MRFIIPFICCLLVFPLSSSYADKDEVNTFFQKTTKLVISIIQDNDLKENQKADKLKELFEQSVDIKWMARFAIAKYWNRMTDKQKNDYLDTYHGYVIALYVPKFREYNNNSVTINSIKAMERNQYMVSTQIISANNKSYDVGYRCKQYDDSTIKIIDIQGENISLINSQRSEFSSIIEKDGVDYLISIIKSKIQ